MRLWHKDLIPVLPDKQLLGQWRECCAIASNIANKGTPNHILVNKIMNYDKSHFYSYSVFISTEMRNRGFKVDRQKFEKYCYSDCLLSKSEIFAGWHNDRYLLQCFCNLQEKYDCGAISKDEWFKILKCQSLIDILNA